MKKNPQALLDLVRRDGQLFAELCLKIKAGFDPATPIVPFIYNTPQELFNQAIDKQLKEIKRVRMVVLKARKMGISTQIEGRCIQMTSQNDNREAKIVSHDDQSVTSIFSMAQLFYEEMAQSFKPMIKYGNKIELYFANPDSKAPLDQKGRRSKISLDSAKNNKAGRSGTHHFVHMSEVGFWPKDADKLALSLMNSVPNSDGTECYMESTANGADGYFYDFWRMAMDGKGGWRAFFLPWWRMESYRMEPPHVIGDYDKDEERLKELYKLDDYQIQWRRTILQENCRGDRKMFAQEYPADWTEAFQSSGAMFFPYEKLLSIRPAIEKIPQPRRGTLERLPNGKIEFIDDPEGDSIMHQPPSSKTAYSATCDTSEGTEDESHDPGGILVNTCPENVAQMDEEVFEFSGFLDPDLLAKYYLLVCEYYNWAFALWESNNHGLAITLAIKDTAYPNYYEREVIDQASQEITKKAGFYTDVRSKPLILDMLKSDLRDGRCFPKTIAAWEQFVSFKRSKTAFKPGLFSGAAEKNRHDEMIILRALQREAMRTAPRAVSNSAAKWDESYYVRS